MKTFLPIKRKGEVIASTLISSEDFDSLKDLPIGITNGYAMVVPKVGVKQVGLHRFLFYGMNYKGRPEIDHINGNPLDNRRENLRQCSHQENLANRRPSKGKSSGYKGIYFNRERKRWKAEIRVNRKKIFIGYFLDEIEAARAYDESAKKHFKDFAYLNFP